MFAWYSIIRKRKKERQLQYHHQILLLLWFMRTVVEKKIFSVYFHCPFSSVVGFNRLRSLAIFSLFPLLPLSLFQDWLTRERKKRMRILWKNLIWLMLLPSLTERKRWERSLLLLFFDPCCQKCPKFFHFTKCKDWLFWKDRRENLLLLLRPLFFPLVK